MNIKHLVRTFSLSRPLWLLPLILLAALAITRETRADSITLSETYVDQSASQATDSGTFSASLTVPGLANFTAETWSNTFIVINTPSLDTSSFGDIMSNASTNNGYGTGSGLTATTATFYRTYPDTNNIPVNAFKLTFSRSGNTLSIVGQTVAAPSLQYPWSIAAQNYYYVLGAPFTPHIVNDPNFCEITIENSLGTYTNADFVRTMLITETDTTNTDTTGAILNNLTLSGTTDFTPPTLTDVSPTASLTVTNGLLPVTVKAAASASFTNVSIANVEFYLNGQDFGPGVNAVSNLWSQNLALLPGVNTIQTLALDTQNNLSATNTLTVTYANGQTNASLINVSEHWLDSYALTTNGPEAETQDAAAMEAALPVPALQTMSATTWSNLILALNFGSIQFTQNLANANLITTNSAIFQSFTSDAAGNPVLQEELAVTRVGGKLLLTAKSINPTYALPLPIIANLYTDTAGTITDQQPFTLALVDGLTSTQYLNLIRTVYLAGTNNLTTSNSVVLNNLQISGAADFTPPTITNIFPATTSTTTNGLLTVQVQATDGMGVTNVEFYVNGQDFGTGANGTSNIWFQNIALIPGTNTIQAIAADSIGNQSVENFAVNYVNTQTNANEIAFYEHWQDGYVTNSGGAYSFSQDAGVVDAAFTIPVLQSMTADTWSNLVLTLSFGQRVIPDTGLPGGGYPVPPYFGGILLYNVSLGTANILTTNSATFQSFTNDASNNPVLVEQVTLQRVGTNLLIAAELLNPSYTGSPQDFFSALYYGTAGAINDVQPFIFTLTDGNNSTQYASIFRPIYIHGTNSITPTNSFNLDNIQIAGAADFTPPVITPLSPATSTITTTNGLLSVTVKATDAYGISNVDFGMNGLFLNGASLGQTNLWSTPGSSNAWSFVVALLPGSNLVQAVALDPSGNRATNSLVANYAVQTNANSITFSEIYLQGAFFTSNGLAANTQDAAVINAALLVPALQTMTAETWSNLNISADLGGLPFSANLSMANILTPSNAVFFISDAFGVSFTDEGLAISRVGGKLILTLDDIASSGPATSAFGANLNVASNPINFQSPFTLQLTDGGNSTQYLNLTRTIYVSGTNITGNPHVGPFFYSAFVDISGAADYTPPTNHITAPLTGQQVSNNTFMVTGMAQDNIGVANVAYSINSSGWSNATTANAFTNWTAPVNLIPGSNSFTTYAYDYDNNDSTTNTVLFRYIPSSTIGLNTNGLGTLSPNYAGAMLAISNTYSITATPASGFVFSNWSGSANVKTATLTFQMQSNLAYTVTFIDVTRPTISVTNLTANQQLSNANFVVRGNAADNWQVTNVMYQLNSSGWSNAVTGNHWTNWNAPLTLTPGPNTLQVVAQDEGGNYSLTNTTAFSYIVSSRLQIQLNGLGTISPNYSNTFLAVGQNYSITATPATGFVFTNWVISTNWIGDRIVTNATLPFTMASNLTLLATLVETTRPLVTITAPTANQRMPSAVATVTGTASDNWKVTGLWYQFNSASWLPVNTTNGWTNWNTSLTLPAGTNSVKAYALDLGGNYSLTNSVSFFSSNNFVLQFAFDTSTPIAANGLHFDLLVSTNLQGHVQYSTNLLTWITLTNFNGTNSTLRFNDSGATNNRGQRFYRAIIP